MKPKTGIIYACDTSDRELGVHLIGQVAPYIDVVKVGLEAMTLEDENGVTLASSFRARAKRASLGCFWDIKMLDVKNTMAASAKNIAASGVDMFTLHANASDSALSAVALAAEESNVLALAVTVLTDLDDDMCRSRFGTTARKAVLQFARIAYGCGIRGFVCSAQEAALLRSDLPDSDKIILVTPAIRPSWSVGTDEQKRVTTPTDAARASADYIVVGRPISNPPLSMGHAQAARMIREELDAA